jgi:hypothetical protein
MMSEAIDQAQSVHCLVRDEGERQAQPQADGEHLLGVQGGIEDLPGHVEHPQDHDRDQQRLKDVGP